jgi:hypothetical protein
MLGVDKVDMVYWVDEVDEKLIRFIGLMRLWYPHKNMVVP